MLHLTIPIGDSLVIEDGRVIVNFVKRSGANEVRVSVDADKSIPIRVAHSGHQTWAKTLTPQKTARKSESL